MCEGEMSLEQKMVEKDEICWRKCKIKRKGKILNENGVKMGRNQWKIKGLTMEVQREKEVGGERECAEVENDCVGK